MTVHHNPNILLNCENLSIGYSGSKDAASVLHENLNLNLYRGDLVCLIGPNGCGKSTLIRTLGGLQAAIRGKIQLAEMPLEDLSHKTRSELLSLVLTEKTIVDSIRVWEIAGLGRYATSNWLGRLKKEDQTQIWKALKLVGMEGMADRQYGTLSDGEKQRTFIAKALAAQSPLMLLDEPTAHLDIPNRVEVMALLRKLTHDEDQTILVSTHDLDLALQLADEIWLMHPQGGVICSTPEELSENNQINQVFGRETFSFLPHSGTFKIHSTQNGTVSVSGSGSRLAQLENALTRLGISISKDKQYTPHIEVEEGSYTVKNDGEQTFSELRSLLRHIRKIL